MSNFSTEVDDAFNKGKKRESYYSSALQYVEGRAMANMNRSRENVKYENGDKNKNTDDEMTRD